MKIKTHIFPKNKKEELYELHVEVLDKGDFPVPWIFKGEEVAGVSGSASMLIFRGSLQECYRKKKEVLQKLTEILRQWENYRYPEEKEYYEFNSEIQEFEKKEVKDEES